MQPKNDDKASLNIYLTGASILFALLLSGFSMFLSGQIAEASASSRALAFASDSIEAQADLAANWVDTVYPNIVDSYNRYRQISNQATNVSIPVILPTTEASSLRQQWNALGNSIKELETISATSESFRKTLSGSLKVLNSTSEKVISSATSMSKNDSAYQAIEQIRDSLARLVSFSEARAGAISAKRVEYDVKNIQYHLGSLPKGAINLPPALIMELVQTLNGIQQAAVNAKTAIPSQESLQTLANSARQVKVSANRFALAISSADNRLRLISFVGLIIALAGSIYAFLYAKQAFQTLTYYSASTLSKRNSADAIRRLLSDIRKIASGDMTQRISTDDENTREIAEAINHTIGKLQEIAIQINSEAELVAQHTSEITDKTGAAASLSVSQLQVLDRASGSLETMVGLAQSIARDAESSDFSAEKAAESVHEGARAVKQLNDKMQMIRGTIQETSKRIKKLGDRSQEIGEILSILSSFSEQVNVLALNASLEASRAGEAGRGFSIIAEEIHTLSQKTEEAIAKIETIIEAIRSETRDTISAMETSTKQVVDGSTITEVAGASLKVIDGVMNGLRAMVTEIKNSTAAQSLQADGLSQMMLEVKEKSREAQGAIEEATHGVSDVAELADRLNQSVRELKV